MVEPDVARQLGMESGRQDDPLADEDGVAPDASEDRHVRAGPGDPRERMKTPGNGSVPISGMERSTSNESRWRP